MQRTPEDVKVRRKLRHDMDIDALLEMYWLALDPQYRALGIHGTIFNSVFIRYLKALHLTFNAESAKKMIDRDWNEIEESGNSTMLSKRRFKDTLFEVVDTWYVRRQHNTSTPNIVY